MKQVFFIIAVTLISACGRPWRCLPKYYKSLLFISFMNSLYYYLYKRNLLWVLNPTKGLHWKLLRALHIFYVTPTIALSFASKIPKNNAAKICYFMIWVIVSTSVEQYVMKRGLISFKHGWNAYWSGFIYINLYLFTYLFVKKPILTVILSVVSISYIIREFPIKFESRFLKGPILALLVRK
ncbi:hypothetical protein [Halalkalibacter akibai]|uniref:Uncharacterized protein n=1 Tax=Halalkalibacter akibai (strain ATCC 43226 / DSM 21942 / CIP 109018 / JCM 9157 / 1139) TaxID=1236973 RepID=W4QXF6_HALA3|nr:hypothetical protein [Halalkalibacter akibai]GAE36815.1 hypothetical protein JCM9157_4035 [Halalkalibacter akibai JCM 9157]